MTREEQSKEFFNFLERYVGRRVTVIYSSNGEMQEIRGRLAGFLDYTNLLIQMRLIPFVGYGCAIYKILDWEGKIIYENPFLEPNYNRTDEESVMEAHREMFGDVLGEPRKRR